MCYTLVHGTSLHRLARNDRHCFYQNPRHWHTRSVGNNAKIRSWETTWTALRRQHLLRPYSTLMRSNIDNLFGNTNQSSAEAIIIVMPSTPPAKNNAEENRPAEGAGDGGGQRKQGERLDPKRPRTASHARTTPTLTHPFTHDPDQHRRGPVSVVWCAPSCLRVTFYPRHHSSGRPQRWASGRQRGLWPADNESHRCRRTTDPGEAETKMLRSSLPVEPPGRAPQ